MIGKLIRCIQCNEVINMTEWDFYPQYIWNEGEIKEIKMDDRKAFLQRHKGHKMEELTPVTPFISDKTYTEPVKTCYLEATNGSEKFLIKKWRNTIDDPFSYEIIRGRIEIKDIKVKVQSNDIKKQIQMEKNLCISEEKVDNFIKGVQKEVEKLNPEKLEISAEGNTPLDSYCRLNNDCIEQILTRCQDKFNQQELNLLRDFVLQNNQYNDVMTLMVRKKICINCSGKYTKC